MDFASGYVHVFIYIVYGMYVYRDKKYTKETRKIIYFNVSSVYEGFVTIDL